MQLGFLTDSPNGAVTILVHVMFEIGALCRHATLVGRGENNHLESCHWAASPSLHIQFKSSP